jgi:transcriptional regulator of NAD metabolism
VRRHTLAPACDRAADDLKRTSWTFHSFTSRDELLSAVDALCRSCDRLVDHDVSGERGDV